MLRSVVIKENPKSRKQMLIRALRDMESGDSFSSGYWSHRNKLPVKLIPKSSIKERRSRSAQRRGKKTKATAPRSESVETIEYRQAVYDINLRSGRTTPESLKTSKRTVGAQQQARDTREMHYLSQRITKILLSSNPVQLVDYLIEKIGEKRDDFVNAMATIFPYEEFPLVGQVIAGGGVDPIETYYKKSVIFSSDKDTLSKDADITEPESQFTDLSYVVVPFVHVIYL